MHVNLPLTLKRAALISFFKKEKVKSEMIMFSLNQLSCKALCRLLEKMWRTSDEDIYRQFNSYCFPVDYKKFFNICN